MSKENKIKEALINTSDGEFIDILDRVIGIAYGLTATEFLIHEYNENSEVKELLVEEYLIPTHKEIVEYMEAHNNDEVGQGDNAWDFEEAKYHLLLGDKYYYKNE